jgi:hypothetical protein
LFGTREQGLAWYQREAPDWIVFGNSYGPLAELPARTRTALLYHGIGTKSDVYNPPLMSADVRFVEGPHYVRRLCELFPPGSGARARVVAVGYAKVDPFFWPESERPRFDLAAAGLDPAKKTLLYAPTHMPSSFPRMPDDFPERFADFNLIVKPHMLSFFGTKRRSHRRKMELWARAPNVHVAGFDEYDPLPLMLAADLLISDESSVLFEFAALDRPIVWCDDVWVHWTRRGPLRYRLAARMDASIDPYRDMAVHARRCADLRRLVEEELARPERHAERRAAAVRELIGPTDGRAGERIAAYLLESPADSERMRAERVDMEPIVR